MEAYNIAVVRGVVSSPPRRRELASGTVVTNIEVTTPFGDAKCSVPVAVYDHEVSVAEGDEVVVCGHVSRRFFRVGGATASRTELVAERVVRAGHTRRVRRALDTVVDAVHRAA
jgi:single-strand DNA-binding protein